MKYVIIMLVLIGFAFTEDNELKFGVGGSYNDKLNYEDLTVKGIMRYKDDNHNLWSMSYENVKIKTTESVEFYNFNENVEQNIGKFYLKQLYNFDGNKMSHTFSLSTGKTLSFSKFLLLNAFDLRFDTGYCYKGYMADRMHKLVLNGNFIQKSEDREFAIRFHNRISEERDWWVEISNEESILKDLVTFKLAYQWDYESYFNYIERESIIEFYINF